MLVSRAASTAGAIAFVLASSPRAAAESARPAARLEYRATACRDEAALRTAVAQHLGYDPFRSDASSLVRASIDRRGDGLTGVVELVGGASGARLKKELRADAGECAELVASMALAISLAVDPLATTRAPAPPPAPPPPSTSAPASPPPAIVTTTAPPPPAADAPPLAPRSSPPAASAHVFLDASAHLSTGMTPATATGFSAGVGMVLGAFSLALEGRAELTSAVRLAGGTGAEATALYGVLAPCLTHGFAGARFAVRACALAAVGSIWSRPLDVTRPSPIASPSAAVGARLAPEIAIAPRFAALLLGEAWVPLVRTAIDIDDSGRTETAWRTADVAFAAGAGARLELP